MSIEASNLDSDNLKSNRESLAPDFLQQQIRLSENKWSPEFRKLIEEKTQEAIQKNHKFRKLIASQKEDVHIDPFTAEDSYKEYKNDLGLNENDLKGKRILDLGFGAGGFVKYLLLKKITSEAYGVDIDASEIFGEDVFKDHFFQGDFQEKLPVQNLDYIVSRQAIGHEWQYEDGHKFSSVSLLENSLAALKIGGEIKIPFGEEFAFSTPNAQVDEWNMESKRRWDESLIEICNTHNISYKIEPTGIVVYLSLDDDKSDKSITLKKILIVRKNE